MIAYVRYNSYRKREYQVITTVVREEEGFRVVKRSNGPEARPFLLSLRDKYKYLCEADLPLGFAEPVLESDGISFQYLEGRPLDSLVCDAVRNGDAEAMRRIFRDYRDLIGQVPRGEMDTGNEDFKRFFGRIGDGGTNECLAVGCLDLILENIFVTGDGHRLIDYEWTFPFPLPVSLVCFRTLMNTYLKYQPYKINELLPVEVLLDDFGIGRDQMEALIRMEWHFQQAVNQEVMELDKYREHYQGILFHQYRRYRSISALQAELQRAEHRIEAVDRELDSTRQTLLDRDNEISSIKASRVWRAGELYRRLVRLPGRFLK